MSIKKYLASKSILKKAKSALCNDSGSVKILTGLTILPMMLFAGVAVDTAEMYRARTNFQAAVDAAAVVTARSISRGASIEDAKKAGEELFARNIENLPNSEGQLQFPGLTESSCAQNGVAATATLRHKLWFDLFHGAYTKAGDPDHVTLNASTKVACGNETVEIALVLDNSGSMRSSANSSSSTSKLDVLKAASTNLVTTLHAQLGASPRPNPVQFSVVPFSGMVNVGAGNSNKPWMDTTGVSPIHWGDPNKKYFYDWDTNPDVVKVGDGYQTTSGTPISRFTLYDNLPGESWSGCVEARPHPYSTTDATPTTGNPATMIVPTFAPDTPDNWNGQDSQILVEVSATPYCERWRWRRRVGYFCRRWTDGNRNATHPTQGYANYYSYDYQYRGVWRYGNIGGGTDTVDGPRITGEGWYENNYLRDDHNYQGSLDARALENTGGDDQYQRQAWTTKYFRNSSNQRPTVLDVNRNRSGAPYVLGLRGGPNFMCTSEPITDLTTSEDEVKDALNDMRADGATNIQQGAIWGMRTLSSGQPFINGRDYNVRDNKKIMIMMTDGNNTYYPADYFNLGYAKTNKSVYGSWGLTVNGRIFEGYDGAANPLHNSATFQQAMDEHLVETCGNIKAQGITIYSIAFDVTNGSSVKTMLEGCASPNSSGGKLYYDASDNAALVAAFGDIAERIAELSITE